MINERLDVYSIHKTADCMGLSHGSCASVNPLHGIPVDDTHMCSRTIVNYGKSMTRRTNGLSDASAST